MEEEKGSVIVRATKDQIRELKGSILWDDIVRELEQWKKLCKEEYGAVVDECISSNADRPNSATTLMHLGDIHGRERAMDYIISIPDVFLQILEDEEDELGHE